MNDYNELFHVVSMKDERAKIVAMEIANDKGRQVLECIFEGKKSTSDIANELNMGLSTVMFHIERLREAGLIKVVDTELSKKFREIKYYGPSKQAILIVPPSDEDAKRVVASSMRSPLSAKLIGVTSLIGATLSGALLALFSNKTTVYPDVLKAPAPDEQADILVNATEVAETAYTLPSTEAIVGIVIVAALVSLGIMMGYAAYKKRKTAQDMLTC
jgi:DNA-binding transcriptional ArsR family regulator